MAGKRMMEFVFYTVLAWIAIGSLAKILFISIQPGQWLDSFLGWQSRLQKWDMEGKQFFAKAGGYCELCFSHVIAFIGFWGYVAFMNGALHMWVTDSVDSWIWAVVVNAIWYLVFICISVMVNMYFIVKLFSKDS